MSGGVGVLWTFRQGILQNTGNVCYLPRVLEAAGLAGWDLLARGLRELRDQTLALHLEICWPGVLEAAGLAGWDLLARRLKE